MDLETHSLSLLEGKALTVVTCSCFIHLQADRQTDRWTDRSDPIQSFIWRTMSSYGDRFQIKMIILISAYMLDGLK